MNLSSTGESLIGFLCAVFLLFGLPVTGCALGSLRDEGWYWHEILGMALVVGVVWFGGLAWGFSLLMEGV